MSEAEHIRFEEWEAGDELDPAHLADCGSCQENLARSEFLRKLTELAPQPEVPPFFAARLAKLAASDGVSFWEVLDQMARRLVPALSALVLITSFLLFAVHDAPKQVSDISPGWLLEEEDTKSVSLDDMLLVLAQADREEGDPDEEQH